MNETNENTRETQQVSGEQIDFIFSLSDETIDDLKKRIDESNGLVRVFIHPYYSKNNGETTRETKSSKGLDSIISSSSEKTPPIIVFEESSMVKKTTKHLVEVSGQSRAKTILVETNDKTSNPKTETMGTEEERWGAVINILIQLGVKKVLIGGEKLEIIGGELLNFLSKDFDRFRVRRALEGAKNTNYSFFGCVGQAIKYFEQFGITVEISNLSHPESRADLLKHESSTN